MPAIGLDAYDPFAIEHPLLLPVLRFLAAPSGDIHQWQIQNAYQRADIMEAIEEALIKQFAVLDQSKKVISITSMGTARLGQG
jgi:hypothetical protein